MIEEDRCFLLSAEKTGFCFLRCSSGSTDCHCLGKNDEEGKDEGEVVKKKKSALERQRTELTDRADNDAGACCESEHTNTHTEKLGRHGDLQL